MLGRKRESYRLLEADDDEENVGFGLVAPRFKKTDKYAKCFRQ